MSEIDRSNCTVVTNRECALFSKHACTHLQYALMPAQASGQALEATVSDSWVSFGWLKMETQPSFHKLLIDRCSSEASVSRVLLLSGQGSPVVWLDDDRWCQWDTPTSWIKHKGMWHWKIAWLKSFIWSNGPGLVSSSLSRGEGLRIFLHDRARQLHRK